MTEDVSLAWLLWPVPPEQFLGELWGVRHHVVKRRCSRYFEGLFAAAELEGFLEYARPKPEAVRLVRTNETCAPGTYRLADGSLDVVEVRRRLAEGYTIVLNGVEHHVPAVARLAHAVEVELNFETQVNAYITPPGSQGFLPHYDDHDVLVLQLQGSKRWHVYGAEDDVAPHEMPARDAFTTGALGSPSELDLDAGDTLYVPRGRVHAAEANAEPSVHLTLGIHAPTVYDLLAKALEALTIRDDQMLERLPPRYLSDRGVRGRIDGLVHRALQAVDDRRSVEDGLGLLEDSLVRRGRCHSVGQLLSSTGTGPPIDGRTRVQKLRPLYSRVLAIDGGVALQFAQSLVRAGADHRATMLFVSRSTEPFQVADLPDLSAIQQIELARELLTDGFLIRTSTS